MPRLVVTVARESRDARKTPGPVSGLIIPPNKMQTLLSRCALRPVYAAITTDQNTKRAKVHGVRRSVLVALVVKVRLNKLKIRR